MKAEATIAPANSVVLVMDQAIGEIPETMGENLIASTSTCIAVGTRMEFDGETRFVLTDEMDIEHHEATFLAYAGKLKTPSKHISICTVEDIAILSIDVPNVESNLKVWANDESEPDVLYVVIE